MKRALLLLCSLMPIAVCMGGCPASSTLNDCGTGGTFSSDGVGVYCGYAVIAGGFRECPAFAPHRFELRNARGETIVICSSTPGMGGSLPLPSSFCTELGATSECRAEPPSVLPTDGGVAGECDPGLVECLGGENRMCCGGHWVPFFDDPCRGTDFRDAGVDCATPGPGCPCETEGAIQCRGTLAYRLVCRGGVWDRDTRSGGGYVCCM